MDSIGKKANGNSIVLMTDGELENSLGKVTSKNEGLQVLRQYLYGRTEISYAIYKKLQEWIECELEVFSPMYKLEGPLYEEYQYRKDMQKLEFNFMDLFTIKVPSYDSWAEEMRDLERTTPAWNCCSQVEGFKQSFKENFTIFLEDFKKKRQDAFEEKIKEFNDSGNTTSRLVLLKKVEGFEKVIEIL